VSFTCRRLLPDLDSRRAGDSGVYVNKWRQYQAAPLVIPPLLHRGDGARNLARLLPVSMRSVLNHRSPLQARRYRDLIAVPAIPERCSASPSMAAGKYDLPPSAREATTTPGGGLIIRTLSSSTSASSQAKHTVSDVSTDPWRSDSDDLEPTSPTATAAAAAAQSPARLSPFSAAASRNSSVSRSAQRRAMWTPGSGEGSDDDSDAGSSGEEGGGTDRSSSQTKRGGSQLYRPAAMMSPYGKALQPAASQPQPLAAAPSTPQVVALSAASMPGAPASPGGARHQRAASVPSEQELEAWRKRQDAAVAAAAARRRAAEAAGDAAKTVQQTPEAQPAANAPAPSPALDKTVSSVSSGSLALHVVAGTSEEASVAAPAVPAASPKQGVTHAGPAITRWLSTDDIPPPPGVSLEGFGASPATDGLPVPSIKSSEVRHLIRLRSQIRWQDPAFSAVLLPKHFQVS